VAVLSIRLVSSGGNSFFWVLIFGGLLLLAIGAHYALYLANATLYIRDGKLGSTNFLRHRREIAAEEASALRLCSVTFGETNVQPYLLALSKANRCAFTIASADHFSLADIGRVASAASIAVTGSWSDQIRLGELNHRHPGALSVFGRLIAGDWRHPRLVSASIVAVLVGLIVVVVVFTVRRSQGLG
jgi:hypothetical protein